MGEQQRRPHLSREQFRALERGQRLLDRQGRAWTVRAEPFVQDGEYRVVLHAGDLVLIERERFADSYALAEDTALPAGGRETRPPAFRHDLE